MKLKVRFEKRDMILFLVFTLILFIVVTMIVSNIIDFAETSTFPIITFTALRPDKIGANLLIFLFAFAGLFFSCKSYFFDLDSGIGFMASKKSDGYSDWAKTSDMKKELKPVRVTDIKSQYAGVPLINDGRTLWVDDGEYHNLIIGSTGSGKTQTIIFPMVQVLAKHGESMVITDPKGEIYGETVTMLRKRGYNIVLLNFRNPQKGNAWNPLSLPYRLWKDGNQDKSCELLDDLAANILYDENNKSADPFWEKTSAGYFSGLALGLFQDAPEEQVNINSISLMSTVGEERFGASTYVKEYFNAKDPNSAAYVNASSTIMSPNETKGSILAVFKEKIKLFASRANLSEMLSHSDFDIGDIGRRKTAVFIVIQDEKKTYHSLATIFVKQVYETLIDVAQSSPGNKLPVRTNFLLDEFANMPPLKDVTTMITAARSRAMRFTLIIQNFAQLNDVYGEQEAETIKGNCGNTIYLISTELKALEEISKMCGEVKSKKDDKTSSTPLITISDLQLMKKFEVIVRRIRMRPFRTQFVPYYKMNFGRKYPVVELSSVPNREKYEVKTFDVREYVKAHRQEKNNLLGGPQDRLGLPMFGGGSAPSQPGGFSSIFGDNKPASSSPFGSSPGGSPFSSGPSSNPFGKDNNDDDDLVDIEALTKSIEEEIARLEKEQSEGKDKDVELDKVVNDPNMQKKNSEMLDNLFNKDNDKPKPQEKPKDDIYSDFWDE